jgi:D-alanyl-lipoteichoic acid acyltransferase DltB (MBOAT superfamily)
VHLLPQFKRRVVFDYARVRDGLMLALWGAFKKLCIADLIATPVKNIFDSPTSYNGTLLLAGCLLFCAQVYCDFSGYSDIAIGLAKVFGFDLIANFRQPYTSTSLAEFWRRWHISLGNWFRDYVYIPLGGNHRSSILWARNILLVFFLSGVWHGAAWTFIVFGLIHGVWIVAERFLFGWADRELKQGPRPVLTVLRWAITQAVVFVGFTMFITRSLSDFGYIMAHLFDFGPVSYLDIATLGLPNFSIILAAAHILVLALSDLLLRFQPEWFERLRRRRWARYAFCLCLVFSIGMFGVFDKVDFVYFQF